MKSICKKRRFEGLHAAAMIAWVLSSSWAGDSIAEQDASVHAPAPVPDVRKDDTEKRMQANDPTDASPCPGASHSGTDAPTDVSVLRKILCWWQDGLSRQSRALIP